MRSSARRSKREKSAARQLQVKPAKQLARQVLPSRLLVKLLMLVSKLQHLLQTR